MPVREVQKFAAIYPVTEEAWESVGPEQMRPEITRMFRDEVDKHGQIVGDPEQHVEFESRISGLRLFPEFEGVDLPPLVAVRMSAYVIPNDEAQAKLDALKEDSECPQTDE